MANDEHVALLKQGAWTLGKSGGSKIHTSVWT